MANYPIYRLVKGSTLTFTEMDGNLEWLSRTMSASIVTITGSTFVLGNLNVSDGITGSLFGTSSWAVSASWAPSNPPTNIYNTDGVLSSNRVVDVNNKTLTFSNISNIYYTSSTGTFISLQASSNTAFVSMNYYDTGSNLVGGWGYGNANVISPVYRSKIYFAGVDVPYSIIMNSIETSRNFVNGNVRIQTGGTYTDNGYKLQVSAQSTSSGSLWVSGSSVVSGSLSVTQGITGSNALITGTITAQTLLVQTITSSTEWITGSSKFGSLVTDTHQFTGSLLAPSITGSLQGTSSWAVSASWAPSSPSSVPTSFIASGSVSASVNVGNTAFNLVSSSNNLVTVLSNGNIGIGTTNPNSKLDVSGSGRYTNGLTITGSVLAPSITGSLQGTSSWAVSASWAPSSPSVATISSYIATGSVTASVDTSINSSFRIVSASNTLMHLSGSGRLTLNTYNTTSSHKGTPVGSLGFNSQGNVLTIPYPISVTGSNIYSLTPLANIPNALIAQNNIFLGEGAGTSSNNGLESNFIGYYAGYDSIASYSNFIGSLAGSSAISASNSNFIGNGAGGSATNAGNSNFIGDFAGNGATNAAISNFIGSGAGSSAHSASYSNFIGYAAGQQATNASQSNFIGQGAGLFARNSSYSNFIGTSAGYFANSAFNSNFIGAGAGGGASSASYSNFIGEQTGQSAELAEFSNFIGYKSGYYAISASYSNFIGFQSGIYAPSASFCTLIGYRVGTPFNGYGLSTIKGISSNNIIIGNCITLPEGTRDSINLGGIIFATGSYFNVNNTDPSIYPLSGSANGKVGINIVSPSQELDVSGSVRISQLLILPPQNPLPATPPIGSIASSGSGANCKPYFWNGSTWTSLI